MFWSGLGRSGSRDVRKGTVSLHVASSASGRTFHRTLSWRAVRALIAAGILLVFTIVAGISGLVGWVGSTVRMRRLEAENDSLRVQFRRLGELESDLARLSELNDKMQKMLGVDLPTAKPAAEPSDGNDEAPGGDAVGQPDGGTGSAGGSAAPLSGPVGKAPSRRRTRTD